MKYTITIISFLKNRTLSDKVYDNDKAYRYHIRFAFPTLCFSRRDSSMNTHFDLIRSIWKFDFGEDQGHQNRSCCISQTMSWWEEHIALVASASLSLNSNGNYWPGIVHDPRYLRITLRRSCVKIVLVNCTCQVDLPTWLLDIRDQFFFAILNSAYSAFQISISI